jgi:uracil phosphoribosyltransferase
LALIVLDHPLVADRVAMLRARTTDRLTFRMALADLAAMLLYEACRTFPTVKSSVETPLARAEAHVVEIQPCLVPITRAGLGMLGSALRLFPQAEVAFVGLKKNEQTLEPVPYLNTTPPDLEGRPVFILDPMVATGGSAALTCQYVADAGAQEITVLTAIASSQGLKVLEKAPCSPTVVAAAVDAELNEVGFIVPGLGDAGDRQFGTYQYGPLGDRAAARGGD